MNAARTAIAPFCTLDPQAQRERIEMIRREVLPYARASEVLSDGRAWEFPAEPARRDPREPSLGDPAEPSLRETLEELVALERECCGDGVEFTLAEDADTLRLEVHGVDPQAEVFRSLEPAAPPFPLARVCRVGGLGLGLSLALFCGVPLVATLWLGAAVAAPVAGLDHPAIVGLGALAFAATLWSLSARRRRPLR